MNLFNSHMRVDDKGELLIHLGQVIAGKRVKVSVEQDSDLDRKMQDDKPRIAALYGAWQGDFEEPKELPFEVRKEL